MSQVPCTNCHRTNRLSAKFCAGCGISLPSQTFRSVWRSQPLGFGTGLLPTNSIINNRYIIIRKIGQGGTGAVYQVTDTQDGHRVLALKEMSNSANYPGERPQMVAQFQQEAMLLQRLSHPNLPYVTDKFSIGDRHYLVMEYIEGDTLQQRLDSTLQPFPEPLVLDWTDQLCDVLGYLHSQNPKIIFRDLKPDNIMAAPDNRVKLIDFGIVRFFKPGKKKDTILLGTKGYAAPEQWGSGQTDERSDIYSLGATLFHLLTAVDPESYVLNIPSVRNFNPSISSQTEQLINKATRPNAQERFASMQQMRQALPAHAISGQTATPIGAKVFSSQQKSSQPGPTARPTTRLVQPTLKLTAQWTSQQMITAGAILLAAILLGIWIITPRIQGTWFWHYVPTIAILGPTIFAATRRQGVAGIGHGITAALAGSLTWYRAGLSWDYTALFISALVSAIAIETVLHFLPQITAGLRRDDPDTWKREAGSLGIAAVAGHIFLIGLAFNFNTAFHPASLIFAFLLGCAGWFVGDLIYCIRLDWR